LLATVGAGAAILFVVAAWRLSQGPISLAFLSPHIEDALNTDNQSFSIRLDDTILTWAGWERTLDIRAVNVSAFGADGSLIATVPELSLTLSARALIRGMLTPKSIVLFRPRIRLVRERDGHFAMTFAAGDAPSEAVFERIFLGLLAPPDPDHTIGYLAQFTIVDADLIIEDQSLEMSWMAPSAQMSLRRDPLGVKGEVSFDLDVEDQKAHVSVVGDYLARDRRIDLGVDFSRVIPAVFSRLSPQLEPLRALDVPLEGTLTVSMTVDGVVEMVGFDLTGGGGQVVLPKPLSQTREVTRFDIKGRFEGEGQRLQIDNLFVDFGNKGSLYLPAPTDHRMPVRSVRANGDYRLEDGQLNLKRMVADLHGPEVSVSGTVTGIGGAMAIKAKGILRNLGVDDFTRYWPRNWGRDAQEWCVAHLFDGNVPEVRAEIAMTSDGRGSFKVDTLKGDMDIDGVTVDYLRPMPMAERTSGRAAFDKTRFDIFIDHGEALGLTVRKGSILVSGLDKVDQVMNAELFIDGPVRNAMRLIDYEPLKFASELGIVPAKTKGKASTRLKLNFLLEHALTPDKVHVSATAKMTDVVLADAVFGQAVRNGRLDLKVDNRGMDVFGDVILGTVPAKLVWRENFDTGKGVFRSRFSLIGRVTEAQWKRDFGLDFPPFTPDFLKGAIGADIRYTEFDGGRGRLEASLDLKDATLTLPDLGWSKAPGKKGAATIDLRLTDDRVTTIPGFKVTADDLKVDGAAAFKEAGGGLARIDFKRLAFGRTDVAGALIPGGDGGWTASVHGKSFDLEPVFDELLGTGPRAAEKKDRVGMRLSVSADLQQVWLGQERQLKRVKGSLVRDGDTWQTMRLDGLVGDNKPFDIRIEPAPARKRTLAVRSTDAGALVQALGIYENMVGGTIALDGRFDDAIEGEPLTGQVTVKDYKIIKAPTLAHLVSIMALTGIVDALKGEGLSFNALEAPFTLHNGVLTLTDAKANGTSLGFTAAGTIYTDFNSVDLKGTVVPAYVINSVFGFIPVFGKIFTGGEKGGGVFAANYTMTGPLDTPKVAVNPLSVLAPGFLRNLFDIFDKEKPGEETPGEKPAEVQPKTEEAH
jgi:hypothetical protein